MIKNIYIDGVKVNSTKIFLSKIANIGSADVEFAQYQRGGFNGQIISFPLYRGLKIDMEFFVQGDDIDDFISQRERFVRLFSNSTDISDYKKTLGFELNNGVVKEVDIVFSTISNSLEPNNLNHCWFTVSAISEKEFFEARTSKTVTLEKFSGGGMPVPMDVPMTLSNNPPGTVYVIRNEGNTLSYPSVTVTGLLTSFNLINDTTSKTLTYSETLASEDEIEIDFYNRTATKDDNPVIGDFSGDWWGLTPGDNQIRLTSSGGSDDGNAVLTYKDSYRNL